ncbi:MAG: DUF3419 family protein [Bacteroidota bacterium]
MSRSANRVFGDIVYAQCWEDPELDRRAFRIEPGDTVFSITSGGCNVLAFLIDDPKTVCALDLNPHQNFLLDAKIGAFTALSYGEMLEFLGVRPSNRRQELYAAVRLHLQEESRRYWDTHPENVEAGIIHTGRYEEYMRLLRNTLRRIKGEKLIRGLFEATGAEERAELYAARWDTPLWRLFTRVFLSRATMSFLFTKDFFQYVDGTFSFGRHFADRVRTMLTAEHLQDNYFASYILLGRYFDETRLPLYLQRDHFGTIRSRLDRVWMVNDSCDNFLSRCADSSIQKFNFTNIFEWMSPEAYERLLRRAWRVGSDGAVLTYRNLLVFRERPASLKDLIRPNRELARTLHASDRSFIYRNYVVEIVQKEKPS